MDGQAVKEDKLILFLQEMVIDRPIKKRAGQAQTGPDGEPIVHTLTARTIKTYAAALIALYYDQKSSGHNLYPHPRGSMLRNVLESRTRSEFVRKKAQYVDRGVDTLQDGYSVEEFKAIVRGCWTGVGIKSPAATIEGYLRTALDFLMCHNMLLRGENCRGAELADLFTIPLDNEGPSPCPALILMIGNGKTNYLGKTQCGIVVRHKDPFRCTMSHLAFYFFYRWTCVREPAPRFQTRAQWYRLHLLKGLTPESQCSYSMQLAWTKRAFDEAHVRSRKKTHAGRSRGAQYAELAGVSESQIRRAGRWNNDALTNCYLSNIPFDFVRSMAGFNPTQLGQYHLPRTKVTPPDHLLHAVWPWVDQWDLWIREQHGKVPPQPACAYDEIALDPAVTERFDDQAAEGFVRLLKELRIILLQDSVLFMREYPHHPLWLQPVFVRDDYRAFAQELLQALETVEEPGEVRLRTLAPEIARQINLSRADVVQTLELQGVRTQSEIQALRAEIVTGSWTWNPGGQAKGTAPPASSEQAVRRPVPFPPLRLPPAVVSTNVGDLPASAVPLDEGTVYPYEMCRALASVKDVWQEWYRGLNGAPAVQTLEATYGAKWRLSSREKMFFSRRKVIVDAIQRRLHAGDSLETAIQQLELVRQREHLTLNALTKWLKKENVVRSSVKGKGKARELA